jgi:hypothetical protein
MEQQKSDQSPKDDKYLSAPFNILVISISMTLATAGCLSLWLHSSIVVSAAVVVAIDCYLLLLIILMALKGDKRGNRAYELIVPHRVPAFIGGILLFAGLIHSFGNMYIHSDGISGGGAPCCKIAPSHLETPVDAIYFSMVTMTTLGYGDFTANDQFSRLLVIWQLCTSVLMLLFFVPLMMSRIAAF